MSFIAGAYKGLPGVNVATVAGQRTAPGTAVTHEQ
jgi:hypothetical protein